MKSRIVMQLGLAAAAMLILFAPASARADFTFDLGTGNSGLSGYTGPYAHVDVHLNSSTQATITFSSLTNGGNIYLLGDGGSVGVNVNAASWTLGSITGSNAGTGFTPGPWSNSGSGNEDGFGVFNQTITSFDGFGHSSDTISFNLTNTGGTWADANHVLTGNADGHLAAAHIFVTSDPANEKNGALTTGFATDGKHDLNAVPAPSSIIAALTGMALFGVIGIAGYRRRSRAIFPA